MKVTSVFFIHSSVGHFLILLLGELHERLAVVAAIALDLALSQLKVLNLAVDESSLMKQGYFSCSKLTSNELPSLPFDHKQA